MQRDALHELRRDDRPGASAREPTILIADASTDVSTSLRTALEPHWRVVIAADGPSVLRVIHEQRPDLVLSDVMMPGLDGFALIAAIRQDPRTHAIPVILLSARGGEEARIAGLEAGADDYLLQPCAPRELLARVRVHLELSLARRRLERDREDLYAVLSQMPASVTVRRGPGHVLEFQNDRANVIARRLELVGQPYRESWPERTEQLAQLDRVYRTGETLRAWRVPLTLPFEDGVLSTRYFDRVMTPLRAVDGRIDGVITFSVDVTENVEGHKRAELAAERLHAALEAAAIGTYFWDIDADVVVHDEGIRRLFGFSADNRPIAELTARVHPDDQPRWLAALERSKHAGAPFDEEFRIIGPGGDVRWVHDKGTVTHAVAGTGRWMSGAIIDITDRKLTEERLEQARALAERASAAKDEFLAMLGHELRNPMAPIMTALELLRMRGDDSRELAIIERQVKHLLQLVDDLLDIAKITRGKVELRRAVHDLAEVVARAVEIATPLLEERGHQLVVDVPHQQLVVDGDAVRLAQVVANLLTNAAKFTPPSGHIEVRARRSGERIVLTVSDDGKGIDPDLLPHVFELFVQGKRTPERAEGGLGLGLALVHNLVRLHGGSVVARSAGLGHGSTFEVVLPVARGVPGVASVATPQVRGQDRRVLVVDDNEEAAELLAAGLETSGYTVRIANDGAQALAAVEDFTPDVAVLDIGLPVMDGYELIGHLRARPALRGCRFIALTGYGQANDRSRSRDAGFHVHLVKPVRLAVLLDAVAGRGPTTSPERAHVAAPR